MDTRGGSIMAINWNQLRSTDDTDPPIITLYGGEGLGKNTLASEFPGPLCVQTGPNEQSPKGATMATLGLSESFQDVIDQADWFLQVGAPDEGLLTFVVDTLDSLEPLVNAEACRRNGWANIEEPGFGKGYVAVNDIWREFIKKMVEIKKAGFNVVLLAHSKVKTDPGVTTDSYPRFRLNLRDDAANAIAHASDIVGFLHQRVSIKKEDAGFKQTNARGEGSGERMIAVEERPGFVAKNRAENMPATIPFKKGHGYTEISKYVPAARSPVAVSDQDETETKEA